MITKHPKNRQERRKLDEIKKKKNKPAGKADEASDEGDILR